LKKKKVLVLNNTITERNPALINLVSALGSTYDVIIIGKDNIGKDNFYGARYISGHVLRTVLKIPRKLLHLFFKFLNKDFLRHATKISFVYLYNFFLIPRLLFIKFDLVLCLETESLQGAKLLRTIFKKPIAYFIYELYSQQYVEKNDRYKRLLFNIEQSGLQYADILLSSVNEILGNYLIKEFRLERKQIVPYTICPLRPEQQSEQRDYESPIKLYYHGVLAKNRGLEEAILAIQDVAGAELYFRGFGDNEQELRSMVTRCGLNEKVFFLAPVDTTQLAFEATKFDVGLTMVKMNTTNHRYACGFKTFENIAAGLGLIVPASYPLTPLISEFKNGITYQDSSVDELTRVFNFCAQNKELINKWKANSRKAYEIEYNPQVQSSRLIDVFNSYLN